MISIKHTGVAAAQKKVKRVGKALPMSDMNKAASIMLDGWVQRNFRSSGGNVGGWKPFLYGGRQVPKRQATAKVEGHYVNTQAKLEMDTGHLRKSFIPFHTSRSAGIGSDLPYSKTQNKTRQLLPEPRNIDTALRGLYGRKVQAALRA